MHEYIFTYLSAVSWAMKELIKCFLLPMKYDQEDWHKNVKIWKKVLYLALSLVLVHGMIPGGLMWIHHSGGCF